MDLSQLHFAHPLWFLLLIAIPLVWGLFFLYYSKQQPLHQLEKFIDKHLIPYLLITGEEKKKKLWSPILFWSFAWSFLVLALAGPRWDFREAITFTRDQSLVILLDLSESMNADDISPSRLGRAKQKVEDLLNMSTGVKIGLVAFAADPHMIVPMTEDKETIRHLLPSLDTDLVYVQGSKLTPALEMASTMLENEPGNNKAIVVMSDGGFEDSNAIYTAKKLADKGIVLYTVGVGSTQGAPLKNHQGLIVKKNGSPIISKLEKEKFCEISKIGHGRYFDADHSKQIALIFEDLEKRSDIQQEMHKTERFWEEHFYLFILPILPFFLFWYRRGYIIALFPLLLMPTYSEASLNDYFYNREELANKAYENEEYDTAADTFQDPYRKGVSYYRMGDYKTAEELFRKSTRPEVASSASYNLGNALAKQNKLEDAIAAYETTLEKCPNHKEAQENLALVRKILLEQKQQQSKDNSNRQKNSDQKKNKQNQEQQEQKEDSSQKEEQSKQETQEDSNSEEKNDDNHQNQESLDSEPSPQESSEEQEEMEDSNLSQQEEREKPSSRSQEDLDADLWLNQIKNDPKSFLKKKFYLESKKNGTKEEFDPW